MSKFVLEKLYQVHRERIRDMEPMVSTHMHIPEFMKGSSSWKETAEQHRKEVIRQENEVIYQRIAKMENSESQMTRESREHKKRVETELRLMKNLKLKGRVRDFLKLQRENEEMLRRIERARPEYTLEACKEWYKHHENFKQGRRSDPTGGHLGFRVPGKLFPKALSKGPKSNVEIAMEASVLKKKQKAMSQKAAGSRGNSGGRFRKSRGSGRRTAPPKVATQAMMSLQDAELLRAIQSESVGLESGYGASEMGNAMTQSLDGPLGGRAQTSPSRRSFGQGQGNLNDVTSPIRKRSPTKDSKSKTASDTIDVAIGFPDEDYHGIVDKFDADGSTTLSEGGSPLKGIDQASVASTEGFHVLLQRPYKIPFQAQGCTIQLLSSAAEYTENVIIRVVTNSSPRIILQEREANVDLIHEILDEGTAHNTMLQTANNDDLLSLRTLLVSMFKEADDDGNEYLTYDEFENLMEKVELGINKSELRFVIQEADENENGVVEFEEFVPLAVDMIQSFRALNRAKIYCSQQDQMFEEEVQAKMSSIDFDTVTSLCLEKLMESDPKQYGVIRPAEFKRYLSSVAYAAELTEAEISQVTYKLPNDSFGRILYNGLGDALKKTKFVSLKTQLVEAQGTELQRMLFELCRKEEMELHGDTSGIGAIGLVSSNSLTKILLESYPNLSRLQICVLLVAGQDEEGNIDYHTFVPIASKAIEYMFEPKALKQRAELIDKTELSSDALVNSLSQGEDALREKFIGLFKSCDIDNSGYLGLAEFTLCVKALEFGLSDDEIEAYFNLIPRAGKEEISFEESVTFLKENLADMEKKKQRRMLTKSLHQKDSNKDKSNDQRASLEKRLIRIFTLGDTDGTGFLSSHEMYHLLSSLELDLSSYELTEICAEADRLDGDEDNLIDYHMFLPTCIELLETYLARRSADETTAKNEKRAKDKAERILAHSKEEIKRIAGHIRQRLQYIDENIGIERERFEALSELLFGAHSGLTRTEAMAIRDTLSNKPPALTQEVTHYKSAHLKEDELKEGNLGGHDSNHYDSDGDKFHDTPDTLSTRKTVHGKPSARHLSKSEKRSLKKKRMSEVNSSKANRIQLHKSLDELIEIITEIRRNGLIRGMLQQMNPTSCSNLILMSINAIREVMIENDEISKNSIYVPVDVCYRALEDAKELKLHPAQIMSIISWAECYDKTGTQLDFQRFSDHAANVIVQLFDGDQLENRAFILEKPEANEAHIMAGLSEEDLLAYIDSFFENNPMDEYEDGIDPEKFMNLMKELPLVKVSRTEVNTVMVVIKSSTHDNMLTVDALKESLYSTLIDICRERYVQRRIGLMGATGEGSAENKALAELRKLADKFIDFIKVRSQRDDGK